MTKYAIMDTEGTGLFAFKDKETGQSIPADAPGQPRLASLSMILLDDDLNEVDEVQLYVKPDGWSMPQGEGSAGAVNGLTDEFLEANGTPVGVVLDRYLQALDEGYVMVAYNAQHDMKQMRAELRRANLDDRFHDTPNICVMRAAMALGVKKAGGGRGFPKLTDCAAHLGLVIDEAHSAKGDTRATLALFRHLHAVGALPEARVHLAKVPPTAPASVDPIPETAMPERF